jgi:hypothetical protein
MSKSSTAKILSACSGSMVGVQLGDGRYGYIPADKIDRFRRVNPDAVVIV